MKVYQLVAYGPIDRHTTGCVRSRTLYASKDRAVAMSYGFADRCLTPPTDPDDGATLRRVNHLIIEELEMDVED